MYCKEESFNPKVKERDLIAEMSQDTDMRSELHRQGTGAGTCKTNWSQERNPRLVPQPPEEEGEARLRRHIRGNLPQFIENGN